MLSPVKISLFIEDVCLMANESVTDVNSRCIHGLIDVLDATGVGTWPFNSPDENFMEYMTALSVAVSHLFNFHHSERLDYVNDARVKVNLPVIVLKKQPVQPTWIPTHIDQIQERFSGREHPEYIVYRPKIEDCKSITIIGWEPTPFDHLQPSRRSTRRTVDIHAPAIDCGVLNVHQMRNLISHTYDGSTRRCFDIYCMKSKADWFSTSDEDIKCKIDVKLNTRALKDHPSERATRTAVRTLNTYSQCRKVNELFVSNSVNTITEAVLLNGVDRVIIDIPVLCAALLAKHSPDSSFCSSTSPYLMKALNLLQRVGLATRRRGARFNKTRFKSDTSSM